MAFAYGGLNWACAWASQGETVRPGAAFDHGGGEPEGPAGASCSEPTRWQGCEVPQAGLCLGAGRRRHYRPAPCPVCRERRPLACLEDELVVCAGCAGVPSPFACSECGSEEHLYGRFRCARCFLRERLTAHLSAPATGQISGCGLCSTYWSTPNDS